MSPRDDPDALEFVRLTGHSVILDQIEADPRYLAVVRLQLPGLRGGPAPATTRAPLVPIPSRADIAAVNACPWRECRTGCQRSRCHAGRGDLNGEVSLPVCVACLSTGWAAYERPRETPR